MRGGRGTLARGAGVGGGRDVRLRARGRHDVGIVPYGWSRDILRILLSNSYRLTPNS